MGEHEDNMEKEVNRVYNEFWKDILEDSNGELDIEQLKKELHDYHSLLDEVPRVYMYVTGGRISKPNTVADEVISEYFNLVETEINEALEEQKKEFREKLSPVKNALAIVDKLSKDTTNLSVQDSQVAEKLVSIFQDDLKLSMEFLEELKED